MNRLTRKNVRVDPAAACHMEGEIRIQVIWDKLLDLILNAPTINSVTKDMLRHLLRQVYDRLAEFEDTGLDPQAIRQMYEAQKKWVAVTEKMDFIRQVPFDRLKEIVQAELEGRVVVKGNEKDG